MFLISLYYTIKLIIPVEVAYLSSPKRYYVDYRIEYEKAVPNKNDVADLLKASYVDELEKTLETNEIVFRQKSSFYYNALMYALLSAIPYIVCLGFHVAKKEDNVQKVEIVNSPESSKLPQTAVMSNNNNNNSNSNGQVTYPVGNNTTLLPGINSQQVISSSPNLIKENSKDIKKK